MMPMDTIVSHCSNHNQNNILAADYPTKKNMAYVPSSIVF